MHVLSPSWVFSSNVISFKLHSKSHLIKIHPQKDSLQFSRLHYLDSVNLVNEMWHTAQPKSIPPLVSNSLPIIEKISNEICGKSFCTVLLCFGWKCKNFSLSTTNNLRISDVSFPKDSKVFIDEKQIKRKRNRYTTPISFETTLKAEKWEKSLQAI